MKLHNFSMFLSLTKLKIYCTYQIFFCYFEQCRLFIDSTVALSKVVSMLLLFCLQTLWSSTEVYNDAVHLRTTLLKIQQS